jgi:hypothetical protein
VDRIQDSGRFMDEDKAVTPPGVPLPCPLNRIVESLPFLGATKRSVLMSHIIGILTAAASALCGQVEFQKGWLHLLRIVNRG